ncbi:MAG: 2,3-bisphosphoglycerate-independent phosphoglycerate mutase, partial [Candidatus Berkelbacteria bacterium Licking1014_85]
MKKVILIILDGWGLAPAWAGNAISFSRTPTISSITKNYANTALFAHGSYVGLPGHEMGNSEVGHLNIGAGRKILQDSSVINSAIKNTSFYKNDYFIKAIENAKKSNRPLHIMGLLSNGMVHSSIEHLFALIDLCETKNFKNVRFHLFSDGRDTPPKSGIIFFSRLEDKITQTGVGKIATISGRFYAMDRDNNFSRISKATDAIVNSKGDTANSVKKVFSFNYEQNITDEYIP